MSTRASSAANIAAALLFGGLLWVDTPLRILAQTPSAPSSLTFEVASIKPTAPGTHMSRIQFGPGGGITITNSTLKGLVRLAYDVQDFQVTGGPGWYEADRYDVIAKPNASPDSENTTMADSRAMTDAQRQKAQAEVQQRLRALLADRFQLKIYRETKEQTIYALVVARGGSKLQEAKEPGSSMSMGGRRLTAKGTTMTFLVGSLSGKLGRPVLDKTGLTGHYDFTLQFAPDPPAPGAGPSGEKTEPGASDPEGPSIFTALQEQLGLKLDSQKGPVEMIVVDHAEKPSEN